MKLDQLLKKKIVSCLLFICCIFAGWLLLTASSTPEKKLKSFAQVDSLITHTLYNFGLSPRQISHHKTVIDSSFSRKTFVVNVTPNFYETKLHLKLIRTFQPYNVVLPTRVLFPDKDLRIHLSFNNTVFRTILIDSEERDEQSSVE